MHEGNRWLDVESSVPLLPLGERLPRPLHDPAMLPAVGRVAGPLKGQQRHGRGRKPVLLRAPVDIRPLQAPQVVLLVLLLRQPLQRPRHRRLGGVRAAKRVDQRLPAAFLTAIEQRSDRRSDDRGHRRSRRVNWFHHLPRSRGRLIHGRVLRLHLFRDRLRHGFGFGNNLHSMVGRLDDLGREERHVEDDTILAAGSHDPPCQRQQHEHVERQAHREGRASADDLLDPARNTTLWFRAIGPERRRLRSLAGRARDDQAGDQALARCITLFPRQATHERHPADRRCGAATSRRCRAGFHP